MGHSSERKRVWGCVCLVTLPSHPFVPWNIGQHSQRVLRPSCVWRALGMKWLNHCFQKLKRINHSLQEFLEAETRQLPNGVYTTAEQRPNAYIPEAEATLPLPKPYGALAPFKPSEPGANIRHIRKPVIKPIEIWTCEPTQASEGDTSTRLLHIHSWKMSANSPKLQTNTVSTITQQTTTYTSFHSYSSIFLFHSISWLHFRNI